MAGRLKLIVALLSASCLVFSAAVFAQSRRLIVVKPNDAELRRTASHMQMCPERVQAIRQLLDEAAELLPETNGGGGNFGFLLFRFNRPKAEETVVNLVEELAGKGREAASRQDYMRLTGAANELIRSLERINPTLAEKLEDQWPPDPLPQGPQAQPGSSPCTRRPCRKHNKGR